MAWKPTSDWTNINETYAAALRSLVSREAHNLEHVGSNPTAANVSCGSSRRKLPRYSQQVFLLAVVVSGGCEATMSPASPQAKGFGQYDG